MVEKINELDIQCVVNKITVKSEHFFLWLLGTNPSVWH